MSELNTEVSQLINSNERPSYWYDWKWQYKNRITTVEELRRIITLSEKEKSDIEFCLTNFRMAITPYYASLMQKDNVNCPIRMQAVPTINETVKLDCEMADPLNEEGESPVPNIVHRYPDRVLFLVTHRCSMYCRHCTRRRVVGEEDNIITEAEIKTAVDYISQNTKIRDVLISGGDPFVMSDERLERIISALRAIEHVEIIRIGTRVPVVMPMRVTEGLVNMLRKYHPIWINTHFNHPSELTPDAIAACARIVDAGIPLGNQSVLLRGINDNVDTMKTLLLKLVKSRVRPYYLYQCDLSQGLGHFRTRVEKGVEIIQALTGNISGYAVPKFVIDAPGGGGKIPVNPEYIISGDNKKYILRNYKGDIYKYPQPPDLADEYK
ncbi:MAG: lysine 2,3-aminomutase [Clostridiales bacterium GWF2_38_85]|nr:MAG: lysine 2,3-aminomutase [Clostridiales bacterium GWF2_38_85]HBL83346.1 lysine 2,3-aminomutase [Clostridiales bacterium]